MEHTTRWNHCAVSQEVPHDSIDLAQQPLHPPSSAKLRLPHARYLFDPMDVPTGSRSAESTTPAAPAAASCVGRGRSIPGGEKRPRNRNLGVETSTEKPLAENAPGKNISFFRKQFSRAVSHQKVNDGTAESRAPSKLQRLRAFFREVFQRCSKFPRISEGVSMSRPQCQGTAAFRTVGTSGLSTSSSSHRAITAHARQLPITLTEVRAISISASMPRMMKIGSVGK